MNLKQDTFILSLGKVYDMAKLSEVMDLYNRMPINTVKHIIVDAHELVDVNVMGLEILMLRDKIIDSNKYSLVFVGLKPETANIFRMLDIEKRYEDLVNVDSMANAIKLINSIYN